MMITPADPSISAHDLEALETEGAVFECDVPTHAWHGASGALPWWLISVTMHAILLFLSMLVVVNARLQQEDIVITEAMAAPEPPEKEKELREVDIKRKIDVNIKTRAEQVFYTPERLPVTDNAAETENEETPPKE